MGTLGGIGLEVGDVLAKKYRLDRLVGEGGTGVVVAARHLQLERDVAIKFLRTALASDEIRMRFEREARAIAQIESEHVVLVIDVGALPDLSPYMVMEYLEGRDLARTLKEDGPLSMADAVDCMLQVCEALGEAHSQGIIHRDLKPANLFLTRREDGGPHIKVVDFGISKILAPKLLDRGPLEMTNAFTVLGSPRYMAPEQLRNSKDVDARADLWSLGAVLFQLLTGKHAFDAENNVQTSIAVLTGEAPLLRTVMPKAPKALEAIVNKCLTKDKAGRFQSAAELADALRPLASERARESLERLQEAREAPNVSIGLGVSSEGARVDSAALLERTERIASAPLGFQGAVEATASSPLATAGLTPPLHPPSQPRPPSSRRVDPTTGGESPSSSPRTGAAVARPMPRRRDPRTLTALIALAGVLAVVLAFGVLTALKKAGQSMGVLPSPSTEPLSAATPKLPAAQARPIQGPSTAVTVVLDAAAPPPLPSR